MVFDKRHLYMVSTSNYLDTIPTDKDAVIRTIAIRELGNSVNQYGEHIPDFIIFDPAPGAVKKFEDNARTLRVPMSAIPGKVYVKLDNYGSPETLSEQVGHVVNTQFVVTFMMAEDY